MDDFQKLVIQNSRDHLIDFCLTYDKHYTVNWHHREIANALEEVEKGDVNLLIIEMPPRHGKLLTDSTPILTKKVGKHTEIWLLVIVCLVLVVNQLKLRLFLRVIVQIWK